MRLSASSLVCDGSEEEEDTESVKGFKKKFEVNNCSSLKWFARMYSRNRIFVSRFGLWVTPLIKNEFKLDSLTSSFPLSTVFPVFTIIK